MRTTRALSCLLRHWPEGWTRAPEPQSVLGEQLVQPGASGVGEGPATVCRAGMRGPGPWWGCGTPAIQTSQALPGPFLEPDCPGASLCPPAPSCGGPPPSHMPLVLGLVPGTHPGYLSRGGLLPSPSLGPGGHPAAGGQQLSKQRRDQEPGRERGLARSPRCLPAAPWPRKASEKSLTRRQRPGLSGMGIRWSRRAGARCTWRTVTASGSDSRLLKDPQTLGLTSALGGEWRAQCGSGPGPQASPAGTDPAWRGRLGGRTLRGGGRGGLVKAGSFVFIPFTSCPRLWISWAWVLEAWPLPRARARSL